MKDTNGSMVSIDDFDKSITDQKWQLNEKLEGIFKDWFQFNAETQNPLVNE